MDQEISGLYFMTVDIRNEGRRGVLTDARGKGLVQAEPITQDQMIYVLGPILYMLLRPKSTYLTLEDSKKYSIWTPMMELCNEFGILRKPEVN